jgi:riboflavin kinase/FMN adenylyltransferase
MKKKSVITIGTFDGVHKGHKFLIDKTLSIAKRNNLKSIIIALEKPVKKVNGLLTSCQEKLEEISALGVDEIILIDVPSEILTYTPDKFFDEFLVGDLNVSEVVCGLDFAFGKEREGDIFWLKKKTKDNTVKINVAKYLKYSSKQISSSYIRALIEKGDVKNAAKILGRPYSFSGIAFKGRGFGKKLGFPTVNLKVSNDKLLPKGVYISLIGQKDMLYPSITNIGSRVTFNISENIVPETHILNFNGAWKNALTKVTLLKKLRDEKKFKDIQDLKNQIAKDRGKALKFFKFSKRV